MIDRICKEVGDSSHSSVKTLVLDNCKSYKIEGLGDFSSLTALSVVNVGLTTLDGFPPFANLKKLNLSDNRIRDGLENLSCPKLEQLKMSNNKVSTLDSLKPLTTLGCLKSVDLFNCPVCDIEEYRNSVFQMLPTLKILDGADVNGEEVDSSDDEEENDDDENDYSADSLSEEEVGLDYLKRNDLEDDEEDVTFEANGHEASEDEEEDSEESSVDNAEDSLLNESSHKRSHSDAFEPEDGSQDQKKK